MDDLTGARRADRQVGWLISLGGSVLILGQAATGFPGILDSAPWWTAGAALMATAVLCLAAAGRVLPFGVLRASWVGIPSLGALLWASAFLADHDASAGAVLPTIWALQPIVASFPVLWARPLVGAALAVVSACLPAASALIFLGEIPSSIVAATPILMTNLAFIAIFIGIRARLTRLQRTEQHAREQQVHSARAIAETQRRAQLGRLVHDEVLSVLIAARSFDGAPPAQLRAEASHALLLLDEPLLADESDMRPCGDVLTTMTATLRRIDPSCELRGSAQTGTVPALAVKTLALAAAEALRNSLRHAGPDAHRRVRLRITPGAIAVTIDDDGFGFDAAAVPPERFGLRESIMTRMMELDGGNAQIVTAPGAGTKVELTWRT